MSTQNGPPSSSLIQQFTMDDSAPFDNETTNPESQCTTTTTNEQQLTACDFEEFPLEAEGEDPSFGLANGHQHQSSASLGTSNAAGDRSRPLWNSASWEDDDSSQFGMQLRQEIARFSK